MGSSLPKRSAVAFLFPSWHQHQSCGFGLALDGECVGAPLPSELLPETLPPSSSGSPTTLLLLLGSGGGL